MIVILHFKKVIFCRGGFVYWVWNTLKKHKKIPKALQLSEFFGADKRT